MQSVDSIPKDSKKIAGLRSGDLEIQKLVVGGEGKSGRSQRWSEMKQAAGG